jgi:hypothetical protein
MEHAVRRLRFKVRGRGAVVECDARIVDSPGDAHLLQAWLSTPEHPHLLLEVGPVATDPELFSLFARLCAHRDFEPVEVRWVDARSATAWMPFADALTGARK